MMIGQISESTMEDVKSSQGATPSVPSSTLALLARISSDSETTFLVSMIPPETQPSLVSDASGPQLFLIGQVIAVAVSLSS